MRPRGDIIYYIDPAAGYYGIYRPGGSFDLHHRWATSITHTGIYYNTIISFYL